MVILGATSPFIQMEVSELEDAIRETFARKGEAIVETNLACFRAGRKFAEENK